MRGAVSADALTRQQLMPLLIEGYVPRVAADFLIEARKNGFIPPPDLLLAEPLLLGGRRQRVRPLRAVLEEDLWQKGHSMPDVLASLQRGNSAEAGRDRDKTRNWLKGTHTPDMNQLLLAVSKRRDKAGARSALQERSFRRLTRALRIARAFEYCMAEVEDEVEFVASVRRLLPEDAPVFDLGTAVHTAIVRQAQRWEGLSELGLNTFARLAFDTRLKEGDIEDAEGLLPLFEQRAATVNAPWATEWMVHWCRARLAIWQGRWEEGLALYDRAFRAAIYRAGPESGRLLREAVAIATTMEKKSAINRYVEQANALGLWPRVLRGMEITSDDGQFLSEILIRSYLPFLPKYSADVPS